MDRIKNNNLLKEYVISVLHEGGYFRKPQLEKSKKVVSNLFKFFFDYKDSDRTARDWLYDRNIEDDEEFSNVVKKYARSRYKKFLQRAKGDKTKAAELLKKSLEDKFDSEVLENFEILKSSVLEIAGDYEMTGLRRMEAPGNIRSGFPVRGNRDSILNDTKSDTEANIQDEASLPAASIILVTKGSKVLAVSRGKDTTNMNMPGGGVKYGEDPAAAAARELHEETGLIARDMIPILKTTKDGTVLHFFRVTSWDGKLRSSNEGVASWEDPETLLTSQYGDSFRKVLSTLSGDVMSSRLSV